MTPAQAVGLLTAEEFFERYCHRHAELVDGVVREGHVPSGRHGEVCAEVARLIGNFAKDNKAGRVMTNDTFIRTKRGPDSVRGPDVLFVSYTRLPPGPAPGKLTDLVPELTVEVLSPSNDWPEIFAKVGEYLKTGVTAVIVCDPELNSAIVYRKDEFPQTFHNGDEFTLPDVLPGFAVPVARFFE